MRRRSAAALTIALATLGAAGCKKGSSASLLLISLTANDAGASSVTSVVIGVSGASHTYSVPGGLSADPVEVGFYVPADVTGLVTVTATGFESGDLCFSGSMSVYVASAGATVPVPLPLSLATGCISTGTGGSTSTGGAIGTGGSVGTGGTTGTGGTIGTGGAPGTGGTIGTGGAPGTGGSATGGADGGVTPPSLTKCTEYNHNDVNDPPCDDANGISNWSIWSVAFSPDGKYLATAGDDGRVKIWNFDGRALTETGNVITTAGASFVAFSPDSSLLVVGSPGNISSYSTTTWMLHTPYTSASGANAPTNILGLAISPDGKTIIAIDDKPAIYSEPLAGTAAAHTAALPAPADGIAISPVTNTGALSVAVAFDTGRAGIYTVSATAFNVGDAFTVESDDGAAQTAAFSPSGSLLAIGDDDGRLQSWVIPLTGSGTPQGSALTFQVQGYPVYVNGLSWSNDGVYLAVSAGSDGGYVSIWNYGARTLYGMVYPKYYPVSVAFSPSNTAVAAGEITCGRVIVCAD